MNPRLQADLLRLRDGSAQQFRETLRSLIDRKVNAAEVAEVVLRRMNQGEYVLVEDLASLIALTRSESLYGRVRNKLFDDVWTLLLVYESRFQDPAIERQLCKLLYQYASNDAEPRRNDIVRAICKVGSTSALPTLEAILFDQAPTAQLKREIAKAVDVVGAITPGAVLAVLEASSRNDFLKTLVETINAVKERAEELSPELEAANAAERCGDPALTFWLEQAKSNVASSPEVAAMCVRRGTELLVKEIHRTLKIESGKKQRANITLGPLLESIPENSIPRSLKSCLETCKDFGNFGSHDQGKQEANLTADLVMSLLGFYEQAIKLHRDWLSGRQ